ncbi:MAG: ABC transporter substrate-binding protein [Desulfovibrio sp.]|nr:ABC transporter substrate-binding protein [Desulfovibrio sp.]
MNKFFLAWACAVVLGLFACSGAQAAENVELKTAWMGENEAFPMWYAVQQGWDREQGLEIRMLRFSSGAEIVQGLLAYDWLLAGCGAVPAMGAILSDRLSIVAVANDESGANAVFVRKGSPIFAAQGANPAFPSVRGSAETVRGKRILCPKNTSAAQMLRGWLKVLGLTEKDVRIDDMPPAKALGAFTGGLGDAVVLWSPQTLQAEQKGLVMAADSRDCGISQPILLVADKKAASDRPETLEKALGVYFRAVGELRALGAQGALPHYREFLKTWAGVGLTEEEALRDLKAHKIFDLRENLRLMAGATGESQLQKWLEEVAAFNAGEARAEDAARIAEAIDARYLEALGALGQ